MTRRIIDLSHPLNPSTPVFPDCPVVEVVVLDSTTKSTPAERHLNSSRLAIGLHCGTHMDAPRHFFGERGSIATVRLERCLGRCVLIDLTKKREDSVIKPSDLEPHRGRIRATRKVILNTGWAKHWGDADYFTKYPVITGEAAQWLVECGVELVGVDTPSVDHPPFDAHLVFLGHDAVIVENLTNLDAIPTAEFQLIALPLKLEGLEASPVRAVALVE